MAKCGLFESARRPISLTSDADIGQHKLKGAPLMAIMTTSRAVPFGAVSTFRIVNLFDTALSNIVGTYRAHKTEKALHGLSNAQLEDIGLVRANIRRVAQRAAHM